MSRTYTSTLLVNLAIDIAYHIRRS